MGGTQNVGAGSANVPQYEIWDPSTPEVRPITRFVEPGYLAAVKQNYYPFNYIMPSGDMFNFCGRWVRVGTSCWGGAPTLYTGGRRSVVPRIQARCFVGCITCITRAGSRCRHMDVFEIPDPVVDPHPVCSACWDQWLIHTLCVQQLGPVVDPDRPATTGLAGGICSCSCVTLVHDPVARRSGHYRA